MDVIRVKCTHCAASIKAPSKYAGRTIRCPQCEEGVNVPDLEDDVSDSVRERPGRKRRREPSRRPPTRERRDRAPDRASKGEMQPAEYIVATLFCPVGFIIGLVWLGRQPLKAKKMLMVSGLMLLVSGAMLAISINVYMFAGDDDLTDDEIAAMDDDFAPPDFEVSQEEMDQYNAELKKLIKDREEFGKPPSAEIIATMKPNRQRAMRANVRIVLNVFSENAISRPQGSGVILQIASGQALIMTNRHCVDMVYALSQSSEESPLQKLASVDVTYITNVTQTGKVIWVGPSKLDLAIVSVVCPSQGVEAAIWQPIPKVSLGDRVFAIGNPVGLGWTYTTGAVSALRFQKIPYGEIPTIQTDAAISPGNSGGGLYNDQGQLIGINRAIATRGQNLGFAIRTTILDDVKPAQLRGGSGK